ncbi:MAG TPA: hypothetical protein VMV29_23765 [Ktedonobacterales bacterium]|nr:hypothetical protein [Ktedonobacterales bacterium]
MGFLGGVGWVITVVIFWTLLFIFAFWVCSRALRAPTDAEIELEREEAEKAASGAEHEASPVH